MQIHFWAFTKWHQHHLPTYLMPHKNGWKMTHQTKIQDLIYGRNIRSDDFRATIWQFWSAAFGSRFEAVFGSVTGSIYYFYQFVAIYNIEHLHNSIIIGLSRSKISPSTKLTLEKLPKTLNFAKSCHAGLRSKFLLSLSQIWHVYVSSSFS